MEYVLLSNVWRYVLFKFDLHRGLKGTNQAKLIEFYDHFSWLDYLLFQKVCIQYLISKWITTANTCPILVVGKNMVIEDIIRSGHNETQYVYRDVVRFSCVEGYEVEGDEHAACNTNGQWTSRPPTCRRKYVSACRIFKILHFFKCLTFSFMLRSDIVFSKTLSLTSHSESLN